MTFRRVVLLIPEVRVRLRGEPLRSKVREWDRRGGYHRVATQGMVAEHCLHQHSLVHRLRRMILEPSFWLAKMGHRVRNQRYIPYETRQLGDLRKDERCFTYIGIGNHLLERFLAYLW